MYPLQEGSWLLGEFRSFAISKLIKRTIYSILETTPACLLREIILVDDYSDIEERPELGQKLKNDIDQNFAGYVRLIRQPSRMGLIQVSIMLPNQKARLGLNSRRG